MPADVKMENNTAAFLEALKGATETTLEVIGGKAETYAKGLVAHPARLAPEIRNSITHAVEGGQLRVGSSLEVAAYIELGTGPNYEPPPEWLENQAKGGKGQAGISQWIFFDPLENKFKIGTPQKARPFLRPAIQDHLDEYVRDIEQGLQNAPE